MCEAISAALRASLRYEELIGFFGPPVTPQANLKRPYDAVSTCCVTLAKYTDEEIMQRECSGVEETESVMALMVKNSLQETKHFEAFKEVKLKL